MTGAGGAVRGAWLALGSNLGDRIGRLRAGLDGLVAGGVSVEAVSAVYDTPPWGIENQPRFANIAVAARTALTPHALLALCKRVEAAAGRDFDAPRNSARPLDVDILLLEGELLSSPDLEIPHPRLHERAFVLVPLAEVAPGLLHPTLGRTVERLLEQVDCEGIDLLEPPGWWRPRAAAEG